MRPLVRHARIRHATRPATRTPIRPVRWHLRTALPVLVAAATVTGLAGAGALPARATVSRAAAGTLRVVIAGPSVDVSVPVLSSTSIGTSGVHVVVVQGPGVSLWSGAATGQFVVRGTVAARGLTPGAQNWTVVDAGDARSVRLPVLVLRQSRLIGPTFTSTARGQVTAALWLQHIDQVLGRWAPSKRSPALVQLWRAGHWVTLTTLTTDAVAGAAGGTFPVPSGSQKLRVLRPEGANVTGVVSGVVTLRVR
jgi:hypothetical protein